MTSKWLAAGSVAPIDGILTWLIQSSALLAAGLLAGRLLKWRGPAVQSVLYRTTLVAVFVCPIASMTIAALGFPCLVIRVPSAVAAEKIQVADRGPDRAGPIARHGSTVIPTSFDRSAMAPSATLRAQAVNRMGLPVGASTTAEPPRVLSAGTTPESVASVTGADWIASMALILLAFWLLGTAFLAMKLLAAHCRMARLRGTASLAEPGAQALCHELAGRMRLRLPAVLRSPFLSSPCLDGLRRPAILLPEDAEQHLRDTFVHELAHLGRRDGLWNLLRQLATAALWVQPLLWVLSRRIEETAEEVCDDFVVAFGADRGRYAGHLLDLAGRRLPPLAPAGVGMISLRSLLARRIARILDSTRSLSTQAGRRTLTATLLAGLAGTILAGLLGVGGGSRNLRADEPNPAIPANNADPIPAPTSAATGQAIKTSQPPTSVKQEERSVPAPDIPITGRIVDLEGRPVQGVTVKVASIYKARVGNLTPWLEAVRRGERPWVAYRQLEKDEKKPSGKVETDAQGRFRLETLGAEKAVALLIEGPTVAHTQLRVVTRQIEPFAARGFGYDYGPSTETIYGADFTFTAAPGRVVEGVVRDAKDGKVMKDVGVWSYSFAGTHTVGIMTLKTRTSGDGRFRLAGFPFGPGNRLLVVPNDDQPYFMREIAIPNPEGLGAIPVAVDLHKGIWIAGKVRDQETGSPVPGAFLVYLPFLDNKFAQSAPEFDGGHIDGYEQRYVSKSDGTFRLVGLPGRAIVGAIVYAGKRYRRGAGAESIKGMDEKGQFATAFNPINASRLFPTSMKEINPAEGAETVQVDIELDPGAKVHLRVVDQQGKLLTGVKTAGRRDRGRYDDETQAQAEFDVVALVPGEDRVVLLVHEGRKLGRAIHVKEGDDKDGPVVVTLEPSATIIGRIVDRDGNPVSGATIQCYAKQPVPGFPIQLPTLASGLDGKFTVANVATGCGYTLVAEEARPALPLSQLIDGGARRDVTVRPGETTDLAEIPLQRQP
jgi:beta-lactamase regulating signal transducer with metallopeptidase domain